jgi:hypothetical protein
VKKETEGKRGRGLGSGRDKNEEIMKVKLKMEKL